MRSPAGRSAEDNYHDARNRRRRRAALGFLLVALSGVLAHAALGAAHPRSRLVLAVLSAGCLLAGFGVWWLRWGPDRDLQRWRRGAAGERATAAVLAELPARRWAVLHDRRVPGSRANLDHLVIGPSGVWLLDTKTTRAVVRVGWRRVHFGKRCLDAGPTKWEAQVVADRLGVAVRPLIVVHGSGLRGRGGRCGGVRVVPPGYLVRCLRRPWHRRRLNSRDAAQLAAEADGAFPPADRSLEKGVTVRD